MTLNIRVTPFAGSKRNPEVHSVCTDMLVLTKLVGKPLVPVVAEVDRALGGLISRKVELTKFKGELGTSMLVEINPEVYPDVAQRYILLVGLGSLHKFNGKAACKIFRLIADKALELGVEHVTVPFVPNRATGPSLNLMGTAHILKEVVDKRLADLKGESNWKELQLLCTPQARRHVQQGLEIPSRHRRTCCVQES